MAEKFNIDEIDKKVYNLGILTEEVIELLGLDMKPTSICISDDKIDYTKKHEHKFKSYEAYKKCVEQTPTIIQEPDYIALHPNGNSIEYIKKIDEIMLVAVRVKKAGSLWVKSVFPISESKMDIYIKAGTTIKVKKD
ncbi:MAG: PBECR2 nuclease fold domain-containing protein [Cellulosilyticaceae bacterium]